MHFDWTALAFGNKKALNNLQPIFIWAPRKLTVERFKQLIRTYLPKGNIVLGLAKEPYIAGYEDQPQFKTLQLSDVKRVIDQVNQSASHNKIYTLAYFQLESIYILEKLDLKKVVLVNGSWKQTFHTRAEYYALANRRIDYDMVSPFASDNEAKAYADKILPPEIVPEGLFTAKEMLTLAQDISRRSFDNSFQTGVTLGKKQGNKHRFMAQSFNTVVPYQAYAMHYGHSRDVHFSPPHDLNYYDTIHAEVAMIIKAQKQKLDLRGTTLFINLLPCPTCARMFTQTDIAEFFYREDHSDGYAIKMLEAAGKKVTRMVE